MNKTGLYFIVHLAVLWQSWECLEQTECLDEQWRNRLCWQWFEKWILVTCGMNCNQLNLSWPEPLKRMFFLSLPFLTYSTVCLKVFFFTVTPMKTTSTSVLSLKTLACWLLYRIVCDVKIWSKNAIQLYSSETVINQVPFPTVCNFGVSPSKGYLIYYISLEKYFV